MFINLGINGTTKWSIQQLLIQIIQWKSTYTTIYNISAAMHHPRIITSVAAFFYFTCQYLADNCFSLNYFNIQVYYPFNILFTTWRLPNGQEFKSMESYCTVIIAVDGKLLCFFLCFLFYFWIYNTQGSLVIIFMIEVA